MNLTQGQRQTNNLSLESSEEPMGSHQSPEAEKMERTHEYKLIFGCEEPEATTGVDLLKATAVG